MKNLSKENISKFSNYFKEIDEKVKFIEENRKCILETFRDNDFEELLSLVKTALNQRCDKYIEVIEEQKNKREK